LSKGINPVLLSALHLARPIALADLARHLHVSVSSISHRFHAETGETPMNRLMHLRLNQARAMLLSGQKLRAIVEATGFSDMAHLSRTFKRFEGVSPRAYLRTLAQAGTADGPPWGRASAPARRTQEGGVPPPPRPA
jgi:transcriptional regulator GlxA family with amidase domain